MLYRAFIHKHDIFGELDGTQSNTHSDFDVSRMTAMMQGLSDETPIEANTMYLDVLRQLFSAAEIHLKYIDGMDIETDTIGNIKHLVQEGDFYKSSDISIKRIADSRTAMRNAGISCSGGRLGKYDRFGRGAYEFSVTLEEV